MWAASIKQSLTIRGRAGVLAALGWQQLCSYRAHRAAAPLPQPCQQQCLAGESCWAALYGTVQPVLAWGKGKRMAPPELQGTWPLLRNMGQQLWQPAGSEMPLFMPHHGNQLLPPQQLLSAVGLPPSPGVGIEDCFMLEAWYRDDKVLGDIDNHLWWGLVGGTDCNATQAMASSLGRLFYSLICKQTAQISFTISHLLQYRQKSQQMKWISPWKALNYIITVENTGGRR